MRPLDNFYEALGANIRARRDQLELTQLDLSELVGLSRTSITNIERGRQRLMADQLLSVAHALKTDADHLLPKVAKPIRQADKAGLEIAEMPTVARFVEKALADISAA